MSYILEALKKSEEKRKQEVASSHLNATSNALHKRKRKHTGKNVALIVAGCTLFSLFGWFLAKYTNNSSQLNQPVTELTGQGGPTIEKVKISPIPELRPKNTKSLPLSQPTTKTTEEIVREPKPLPSQVGEPPGNPQIDTPPSYEVEKVPLLKELASEIRDEIPELKLAGHVYSPDPSLRLILINSDIKREKESITKELTLDEITPDGVIIDYNDGIKFRLSVK